MHSITRTRVVETMIVPGTGTRLFEWGPASWRTIAPPDVFVLALDKAIPLPRWHKGPVPMPKLTTLIPTLKQVSALSHFVIDIRQPETDIWEEALPTWSQTVIRASLSNRYYRHLPVIPNNADESARFVASVVASGRTPVLFGDRAINIAPFANNLVAAGLTVGELEWQSAPAAERTSK